MSVEILLRDPQCITRIQTRSLLRSKQESTHQCHWTDGAGAVRVSGCVEVREPGLPRSQTMIHGARKPH